jgi:hypothetical protein
MKLGLLAASLVLVAGGAVGCGNDSDSGGGGAKDDGAASTEDFCAAFQAFSDDLQDVTGEEANLGEILKTAAKRIEDVGTPKGIPDDAKDGLQLTLDAIADLPDDASAEDMSGLEDDFSEADKDKTDAFTEYLEKTCPDLGGSGDSETDSGDSSDDPSEGS